MYALHPIDKISLCLHHKTSNRKKKQNTWIIELAYQQIFGASIVLFDCVRYRRRIIHDRVFMALFKILH